jgi:peptidyl-tRNA hydrolase, PTH1 family
VKVIVGLGNPGKKYDNTRHNVGFDVIDQLASRWNVELNKEKSKGLYGQSIVNGEKVILLKPLTFMNLSGEAVRPMLDYYNIDLENLLVIYDDLDLVNGRIRLRQKGSAGGHNGIKSLIQHLGSEKFNRIRIGIDRPPSGMAVPNYVLGKFTKDEQPLINDAVSKASDACEKWLDSPFIKVMNEFN